MYLVVRSNRQRRHLKLPRLPRSTFWVSIRDVLTIPACTCRNGGKISTTAQLLLKGSHRNISMYNFTMIRHSEQNDRPFLKSLCSPRIKIHYLMAFPRPEVNFLFHFYKTFSRKLLWNRCLFGLSREVMNDTFCHALLRSDELYCPFDQSGVAVVGATNAAVTVSLVFPPLHPHATDPTASIHGHLRSRGTTGDCEQCNVLKTSISQDL